MTDRLISSEEIEAVIRQLRDVKSVKVVLDEGGQVEEVHVLVDSKRSPKQIVRDVESAVMARLGLALDHRKISVAQISEPPSPSAARPELDGVEPKRLAFSDVRFILDGARIAAHVTLRLGDHAFSGAAEGPNTSYQQLRLVAQAALNAVQSAHPEYGTFILEDIQASCQLAGKITVVCLVNLVTRRGQTLLTGSALVFGDQWKAAVNATLDAVNRVVGYSE